jgi:RND family efflux transporter MFP subunit
MSNETLLNQLRIDRDEPRKRPPRRRRRPWLLLGAGAAAAALAALAWYLIAQPDRTPVREATAAAVSSAGAPQGAPLLDASGYVVAQRAATVSAKIPGKVVAVLIQEGQRVAANEIIARLDDSNARAAEAQAAAQVGQAQANVRLAEAALANAQVKYRRYAGLNGQGVVADQSIDDARTALQNAQATLGVQRSAVMVASAGLAVARRSLDDTIVRAPFAGVVTATAAQPGEIVAPVAGGGFTRTGICTIVDMDSLEVDVDVAESFINRVRQGMPAVVRLNAYPDWAIPAELIAVIPTADRSKATVAVRVALKAKDPRIVPEMGARVTFLSPTPAAGPAGAPEGGVSVPDDAVKTGDDGQSVVFVVSDGRVERRAVRLGPHEGANQIVIAGLRPGEVVAISEKTLAEGDKVRVAGVEMASVVSLKHVIKRYRRGRQVLEVLHNLDLDVEAGEFLALMGPSGSGKTTLLNLIGGLDRPTEGEVVVAGENLDSLSGGELAHWRSRHVGFVFQFYNLMPTLSAERNVELPLLLTALSGGERKKRVEAALALVGLTDWRKHRPNELSGGQQQRVAIARALVADPTLLVCDEPTGDLDRETAEEVLGLVQQLNRTQGKTVVMVTHDPKAASFASRIVNLDKGALVAAREVANV